MKLVEGRLGIYRAKRKTKKKTYTWEEAKIVIPSTYIEDIREYQGEKVLLLIMRLNEIELLEPEAFRRKYADYNPEFFPKKEESIALLNAPNIDVIYAHKVDNPEKAVKILEALMTLKNRPVVITDNIHALEKALKHARKHIDWNEIREKQKKSLLEDEKARQTLLKAFEKIAERNQIKQLIKKMYRRKTAWI